MTKKIKKHLQNFVAQLGSNNLSGMSTNIIPPD